MQWRDLIKLVQADFSDELDYFIAKTKVFNARRTILKMRPWSFNLARGIWYSPSLINVGTIAITQFQTQFTVDPTVALPAWTSAGVHPPINQRQIRFGTSGSITGNAAVNVYSIVDFDGVSGIGHTDRDILESTNPVAQYQMYRSLYGPPWTPVGIQSTDPVAEIINVYDPTNNYSFVDVTLTADDLDRMAPQRSNVGPSGSGANPYYLASAPVDINGNPQWEMWPAPTVANGYVVEWQMTGAADPLETDSIPARLNMQMIQELSLADCCLWAAKRPAFKGVNMLQVGMAHRTEFRSIYLDEARNDDEIQLNSIIRPANPNIAVGDDDRTGYYSINPGSNPPV